MALFFDLSIPYLERDTAAGDNKSRKDARLKSAVRAMELGYAAVAYDRPHRGIISDADRCKIPPFPLSSLLRAAPALAASASFHRGLLSSPLSSTFRQYSRITVAVDSAASASSLNAGNHVVRSYDIVAARPLNQTAFDQACKVSEVDIIAIDFSQKLPFRLKRPMVEAATKRGLHFEITYSHLIGDVNLRRQMLSDAKLLVDWTRGKNLIFSSAAPTVNEIRGPYDVANLSAFLLGLPMERAKAAISGNCRTLITNTLRKKHCYKEAIRIERIPDEQVNSKIAWFGDWNNWDPISSGDGDLPSLDDTMKFFSAASKVTKNLTPSDFMSVTDGTQSKEQVSREDNMLSQSHTTPRFSFDGEPGILGICHESPPSSINGFSQKDSLLYLPIQEKTSVVPMEQQASGSPVPSNTMIFTDAKEPGPPISHNEDPRSANYVVIGEANLIMPDANMTDRSLVESIEPSNMCVKNHTTDTVGMPLDDLTLKICTVNREDNLITSDVSLLDIPVIDNIEQSNMCMGDHTTDVAGRPSDDRTLHNCTVLGEDNLILPHISLTERPVVESIDQTNMCMEDNTILDGDVDVSALLATSKDASRLMDCIPSFAGDQTLSNQNGDFLITPEEKDLLADQIIVRPDERENKIRVSIFDATPSQKDFVNVTTEEHGEAALSLCNEKTEEHSQQKTVLVGTSGQLDEGLFKIKLQEQNDFTAANGTKPHKILPGKRRHKERLPYPAYPLPLKGLLKPMFFKRKAWRLRRPSRHL